MSNGKEIDDDIEALTLLGSSLINTILDRHPIEDIKALIDAGAPLWYQDEVEGMSPLHAAAYLDDDGDLAKYLLDNGAIWNAGGSIAWTCVIAWQLALHPSRSSAKYRRRHRFVSQ